jgi:aryl-alcohol dehydrogenase-like predicted oxidoreductase
MIQRRLGRNGPMVSALGLGCMGMSEGYGASDEREAVDTIHRALDLGVRLLDTADIYGPLSNELLIGRALRDRRSEAFVATKFGFVTDTEAAKERTLDARPDYVQHACEASLRRLGLETIDLYYLHRVDPSVPIEETLGAMARLVTAGKVRYLGLSEVGSATLARAHAVHPITALQSEYSLWTRDLEASGTLAACRELGIGVVPFSPLGRGFLTGAIRTPDDFAPDDFRRDHPRFTGENFALNLRLVAEVKRLADAKQCTSSQLALAWVLAQGEDFVPIPGTKRRERLEENCGAIDVVLNEEDLTLLAAIFPPGAAAGARYPDSMLAMTVP